MEGRRWRMRLTLLDLLAVQHSSNLRDLLRYREEEEDGGHQVLLAYEKEEASSTLTLAFALAYEKKEASSTPTPDGRTLLDISRNEESGRIAVTRRSDGSTLLDIFREDDGSLAGSSDSIIWRTFKEHLCRATCRDISLNPNPRLEGGWVSGTYRKFLKEKEEVVAAAAVVVEGFGGIGLREHEGDDEGSNS